MISNHYFISARQRPVGLLALLSVWTAFRWLSNIIQSWHIFLRRKKVGHPRNNHQQANIVAKRRRRKEEEETKTGNERKRRNRGGTEEEKNSRILVVLGQSFCRRDQLCKELGVDLSTVPGRPTRT